MQRSTLALLAVVAGSSLAKSPESDIRVVPLAALEATDDLNAALWSTQAACGSSLRYSINPAWNAEWQEQSWYATIFGSSSSMCEGDVLALAHHNLVADRVASTEQEEHLYWVSQSAVAQSDDCPWYARLYQSIASEEDDTFGLDTTCDSDALVFQRRSIPWSPIAQLANEGVSEVPRIVHLTKDYALLALSRTEAGNHASAHIDRFLPPDTHISLLDAQSPSIPFRATSNKPEPTFPRPEYDPVVAKILNDSDLAPERIAQVVRTLSGEDQKLIRKQGFKGWFTRHSGTFGARNAAEWIKADVSESLTSLPGAKCELWEYNPYYATNVVCTIPPATEEEHEPWQPNEKQAEVILSAHYDSRGTFGELTAPGADDDGSGTTALIVLARTLGNFGVRFRRPVRIVFFSGEEQGLLGSLAYVKHLKDSHTKVHLQFQLDMLAYHLEGEPHQIAFPDKLSTSSATKHVMALTQVYVPELVPGFTPACCSDHQRFWEQGYASTWAFEHNGPIVDPFYHNSGDLANRPGYDFVQLQLITKVVLATLLTRAEFYL